MFFLEYATGFNADRIQLMERKRWGDLCGNFLHHIPEEIRPVYPEMSMVMKSKVPINKQIDRFFAQLRNPQFDSYLRMHALNPGNKEDNCAFNVAGGGKNNDGVQFFSWGDYFEDKQDELLQLFRKAWDHLELDVGYIWAPIPGKVMEKSAKFQMVQSPDILLQNFLYFWGISFSPTLIDKFGGREQIMSIPQHFPGWVVVEMPHQGLFFYDASKPVMEPFTYEDVETRDAILKYLGDEWLDGEKILPEVVAVQPLREKYGQHILDVTETSYVKYQINNHNPNFQTNTANQRRAALESTPSRLSELVANPVYDEAELQMVEQWAREHGIYEGDPEDKSRYYHPDIDLVGYYFGEWLRQRLGGEWLVDYEYLELPEWQIKLAGEEEPFRRRLYPIDEVRILMLVNPDHSLVKEARSIIRVMGEE